MATAYIGLGSNLGDRLAALSEAVDGIAHFPDTHVERVSNAYESEAAYVEDQPPFLNAVIEVSTMLTSDDLFTEIQQLEESLGRVREQPKGPRAIDIDLLLFEDEERTSDWLTLPHPGMLEREFVVVPLLAIAPRVTMPDGTHPRRSNATTGPVLRDLGPVPDAGAEHNMPVTAAEWVVVAETEGPQASFGGYDAGLELKRSVLEQEGIPYAFQPFAPGSDVDILGRPQVVELVVPVDYQERAIALLEAVEAAPLEESLADG